VSNKDISIVNIGDAVTCVDKNKNTHDESAKILTGEIYRVYDKFSSGGELAAIKIRDDYGNKKWVSANAFEPVQEPLYQDHPMGRCVNISYSLPFPIGSNVTIVEPQSKPQIDRVIFSDPATVVFWKDGTKTVSKCQDDDTFSEWVGLAICHFKKAYSSEHDKAYIERVIKRAVRK
jgi:hypothetical protein